LEQLSFVETIRPPVFATGAPSARPKPRGPAGAVITAVTKAQARRLAMIRRAGEILQEHPLGEGESLHAIVTGYFDLSSLVLAFLEKTGSPCLTLRCSTLSLSPKVTAEFCELLDSGTVKALDLIVSDYFRRMDPEIMAGTLRDVIARGGRVAAAKTHTKLATMELTDGRKYVIESSANLRGCRMSEFMVLTRDVGLHRFYDEWLADQVARNGIRPGQTEVTEGG